MSIVDSHGMPDPVEAYQQAKASIGDALKSEPAEVREAIEHSLRDFEKAIGEKEVSAAQQQLTLLKGQLKALAAHNPSAERALADLERIGDITSPDQVKNLEGILNSAAQTESAAEGADIQQMIVGGATAAADTIVGFTNSMAKLANPAELGKAFADFGKSVGQFGTAIQTMTTAALFVNTNSGVAQNDKAGGKSQAAVINT